MGASSQSREFFTPLESLRGIAALGVILFHMAWAFPLYDIGLIRNGYLLVDLFFVLSGFVISHNYGTRIGAGRDVVKFIWLRFGRVYPLHVALLCVFLAIEVAKHIAEVQYGLIANKKPFVSNDSFAFLSNLLLLQGLGIHGTATYNPPAWSISTEFYTYALFSMVLLIFRTRAAVVATAAILILMGIAFDTGEFDRSLWRCIAGFFTGVLAQHCYVAVPKQQNIGGRGKDLPGLLTLAGVIMFLSMKTGNRYDALMLPLVAALIIFISASPNGLLGTALQIKPLLWMGKVSYSMYMVHVVVIWTFSQVLRILLNIPQIIGVNGDPLLIPHPLMGLLFLAATVACILMLSHMTYTYIEDPCRKKSRQLAEKWFATSRSENGMEPQTAFAVRAAD